jgi:NAD(P)-dependent dehydrogenase (short-subunit alcohol dehydrogenase family)
MDGAAASPLVGAIVGGEPVLRAAVSAALSADGVEVAHALEAAPALDILVFIAGEAACAFSTTDVGAFSERLGGELRSAFLTLQKGVRAIRAKGGGGSVVFVAPSSSDHRSFDALQQGLRLLAKSAALELGAEGIRVNVILPGAGENPLGHSCTPGDVAASVAFAASARAHFMTGADLPVDGGRLAQ